MPGHELSKVCEHAWPVIADPLPARPEIVETSQPMAHMGPVSNFQLPSIPHMAIWVHSHNLGCTLLLAYQLFNCLLVDQRPRNLDSIPRVILNLPLIQASMSARSFAQQHLCLLLGRGAKAAPSVTPKPQDKRHLLGPRQHPQDPKRLQKPKYPLFGGCVSGAVAICL